MNECTYPDCDRCPFPDCMKDTINGRRKYKYSKAYKDRTRANMPHCDECEFCFTVQKERANGSMRICSISMRIIADNVTTCPHWCVNRGDDIFHRAYIARKEKNENITRKSVHEMRTVRN